jgi:hypothetical protein
MNLTEDVRKYAAEQGVSEDEALKRGKSTKAPAFVLRAERALRRAAHNVKTQNRALGLPVIFWQNGKVVEKPV